VLRTYRCGRVRSKEDGGADRVGCSRLADSNPNTGAKFACVFEPQRSVRFNPREYGVMTGFCVVAGFVEFRICQYLKGQLESGFNIRYRIRLSAHTLPSPQPQFSLERYADKVRGALQLLWFSNVVVRSNSLILLRWLPGSLLVEAAHALIYITRRDITIFFKQNKTTHHSIGTN